MIDIASVLMTMLISGGALYFCCCSKREDPIITIPLRVEIPPAYDKPPEYSVV